MGCVRKTPYLWFWQANLFFQLLCFSLRLCTTWEIVFSVSFISQQPIRFPGFFSHPRHLRSGFSFWRPQGTLIQGGAAQNLGPGSLYMCLSGHDRKLVLRSQLPSCKIHTFLSKNEARTKPSHLQRESNKRKMKTKKTVSVIGKENCHLLSFPNSAGGTRQYVLRTEKCHFFFLFLF